MTLTEIKKELYKQKPKADLVNVTKSGILYSASIKKEVKNVSFEIFHIKFLVPLNDIGDAKFGPHGVDSQLLIRYIVNPQPTDNI